MQAKCFLNLEMLFFQDVLSVNYTMKQLCTFFYDCLIVKVLWNQLKSILSNNLIFPLGTPQSAIFGFWDLDTNEYLILFKSLTTYFQNVHLQCKNNRLLESKSSADIC